jgi:glutathione peroxidase
MYSRRGSLQEGRVVDDSPDHGTYDLSVSALDGSRLDLRTFAGRSTLIVNVASRCGLTPQYAALERLHDRYAERGFSVLGVPCNQFGEQEPGDEAEITVCSASYGVTFPLTTKLEVNGVHRHPLYARLTAIADERGEAGDVQWNFEKFLVSRHGLPVHRFRPQVDPESDEIVAAIEAVLDAR